MGKRNWYCNINMPKGTYIIGGLVDEVISLGENVRINTNSVSIVFPLRQVEIWRIDEDGSEHVVDADVSLKNDVTTIRFAVNLNGSYRIVGTRAPYTEVT